MGNQNTSDSKYGKIDIWTEKSKYTIGDQINGKVLINLIQPFPSKELFLIIEGKEKTKVVFWESGTKNIHKK
jgi:hypothetical protein